MPVMLPQAPIRKPAGMDSRGRAARMGRVSFDVAAAAYDRYMGLFSAQLSPGLADLAGVRAGWRVLDVGCGPGALTSELVTRLGPANVVAVDPSEPFVDAARERHPGVVVTRASAESLPFAGSSFEAALAQLVVHFMAVPVGGLREMARVTRPGGVVAASVWDFGGGRGPVSRFWDAARSVDPDVRDESNLPGVRAGDLETLFVAAGLIRVEVTTLEAHVDYATFEDWWGPYTRGVGPGGAYLTRLEPDAFEAVQEACRRSLPEAPFTITAAAWACRGTVPAA
jgi:SAM-dependent methyltransferase